MRWWRRPWRFAVGKHVSASLVLLLPLSLSGSQGLAQNALTAQASVDAGTYRLGNTAIRAEFQYRQRRVAGITVKEPAADRMRALGAGFSVSFADGKTVHMSDLSWAAAPRVQTLSAAASTRAAEGFAGRAICAEAAVAPHLKAHWCMVLRDGSAYVRQTLALRADGTAVAIREVTMLDLQDAAAHVAGTVAGSPVIDDGAYFAFEHPLARATVEGGHVVASLRRTLPLQPGAEIICSSVVGFAPRGQMRRTFLAYLERERIHPYRPFLTYNSWYDLGTGNRYDEAGALNRVEAFGQELVRERSVKLDSFLFDDGWDDTSSFWQFNSRFPHGMVDVGKTAASFDAGVGFWLSPWGGYDEAKLARIHYGTTHGYEIVKNGYALSGPRYFKAFEHIGDALIREDNANQFKIDGTGNANQVFPGSAFDSDFDAAINLLSEWRQRKPDLFLNLTTGTYPSPFWLMYADSIWRGGEDHDFAGVGSWRQKWITYRDAQTYKNIVGGGPLFPLNSLMLHSIIYGVGAEHLDALKSVTTADDTDFADEVWTFFGCGTDLQELYVTPALLNKSNWDELAEGARWSRNNSATLLDTHWVGGNPAALEPYGWASWTPQKAILVLRNPADRPQEIRLDAEAVFELPVGSDRSFHLIEVRSGRGESSLDLQAGTPATVTLAPFEVRVLETRR